MSLISLYSQLPIYPSFVAIDTSFKGNNTVFNGVKNTSVNLNDLVLDEDYTVIEGINLIRSQYQLYQSAGYNPGSSIYQPDTPIGNFWVYKTAPYQSLVWMNGLEGYAVQGPSLDPSFPLVIDWDVYNYYRINIANQPRPIRSVSKYIGHWNVLPPSTNLSSLLVGGWGGVNNLNISIEGNYNNYVEGKWNWDWSYWDISQDQGNHTLGNTINHTNYISDFQFKSIPTVIDYKERPTYIHLLSGYPSDSRTIADSPTIVAPITGEIEIKYYRQNKLEPVPNLRTIDWHLIKIKVEQNISFTLPISGCVIGTLSISNPIVKSQILNTLANSTEYPYKYYFSEYLPELFLSWNQLVVNSGNLYLLRILAANNNHWNNRPIPTPDLNFDITHPMLAIDNERAYNWHIKPQSDSSYGDLVMDSPRTIETRLMIEQLLIALNALQYQVEIPAIVGTGTVENPETPAKHKLDWYIKNTQGSSIPAAIITKITEIWKALGGAKYATNQLDNTKDRVTNLGFLTERIAKVLGIRFDDNGKIDVDKEKSIVRKVIDGTKNVDAEKVGINSFGDGGLVVKRINNRFKQKGEIVSDQCVVVQDMPDLIQEYFHQANLALGIQESSAIEIKQDGTVARFNSQLEILVELVNLMSSGNEMTRAALVSSLVTQSQTNELIAGLGLPSVTKTIPVKIGKKVSQLPFKGIAAHRSIAQEVATCTYNVGIVLGQVL